MEYDLSRIDYTICGITYPETLKILPNLNEKLQQKFAVGDKNGVLQCLAIKDEEPIIHFKTLPGKPITSVHLAINSGTNADKIFAASGNEVKGYTRKGKVFFNIETSVSETITSMCVLGNDLILCSGRTITYCKEFHDISTFICEDRVLDAAAFAVPNSARARILLLFANKGVALFENGNTLTRIYATSGPSRLVIPPLSRPTVTCAFYGAVDGSIGFISYSDSDLKSKTLVEGQGLGSVVCMGWFSNNMGVHLAVGRHDGCIQLYLSNPENYNDKLQLKFTYFCGEPVTSVCGGCIGSDEPELLVSTFSGRIFGLRPQGLHSTSSVLSNVPADALAARKLKLENEIIRLEKQTAIEREKYQKNTRSLQSGLSIPPMLDIQYELVGANKNGWQEAKIISAVPLDMLFVYCNRKLELQTDSAAVLSLCPSQERNDSDLLATIRCQAGTRRLWIKFRNKETGLESIKVFLYVLPAGAPRVARLIKFNIPILAFYSNHENVDPDSINRCFCELKVSGAFSVVEVTSWLSEALPELPKPGTTVKFVRSHTLAGTFLICQYQRGSAIFRSDNIATISDMKDIISYCTVKKSLKVNITLDVPPKCCLMAFENIENLLKNEYKKKQEITLKTYLSELDLDVNIVNEDGKPLVSTKYLNIWRQTDSSLETYFDELKFEVERWYKASKKLAPTGTQDTTFFQQLQESLKNCMVDEIKHLLIL